MADVQPRPGTAAVDPAPVGPAPHAPTRAVAPPPAEPAQDAARGRRPAPNQLLALALAVGFVVAGAAGWAVTGGMAWNGHDHTRTLAGFAVNPLHNAVHLAVGLAGLVLWRRPGGVRGYGLLVAVLYAAVLVYGLVAAGRTWDVLNVNPADNVLHLVTVVLGLVVAAWPRPAGRLRGPAAGPEFRDAA
ncbi:DUF4383 domain-containing protein [Kineosporia sp. A_224]|uniref:DUF4383 domain-containing protein n=1 Tax=Kineosporia sp. A_224 TaxID=1962180 RepID=UPI000B4C1B2B|nr:DUF4383 domain-containing protein [Kineosporia sp. A_224]